MNNHSEKIAKIKATNLFDESWYVTYYSIPSYKNTYIDFLTQDDTQYKSPNICFDAKWYLSQYHNDFDWNLIHPLVFYSLHGWQLGHDPSPNFSTKTYLELNSDISDLNINPLEHYLNFGRTEGRSISKSTTKLMLSFEQYLKKENALIETGLFLKSWYKNCNTDIDFENINPIQHFILKGVQEGRKPNPYFDPKWYANKYKSSNTCTIDTVLNYSQSEWKQNNPSPHFLNDYYLENNLDAKENNFEPLYHYLQFGIYEHGRSTYSYHDSHKIEPFLFPIEALKSHTDIAPLKSNMSFNIHIIWEESSLLHQEQKNFLKTMQYAEMSGHKITIWYVPSFYFRNNDLTTQHLYTEYGVSFQNIRTDFSYNKLSKLTGDIVISNSFVLAQTLLVENCLSAFSQKYFFLDNYIAEDQRTTLLRHFQSTFKYITTKHNLNKHININLDLESIYLPPLKYENFFLPITINQDSEIKARVSQKQNILLFYNENSKNIQVTNSALEALKLLGYDFTIKSIQLGQLKDFGVQNQPEETLNLFKSATLGIVVSSEAITSESLTFMNMSIPTVVINNNSNTLNIEKSPLIHVSAKAPEISQTIQKLLDGNTTNPQVDEAAFLPQFNLESNYLSLFSQFIAPAKPYDESNDHADLPSIKHSLKNHIDVTIVIPTYNGGDLLKEVVKAIQSQIYPAGFEVIIIDSESTDNTRNDFKDVEGVVFHEIAKQDFNHGGTRNLGVSLAQGEYVAFITQDAIPANDFWLYNLVSPLKTNVNAAGVFGRHIPYQDTSKYLKRDLNNHFIQFNQYPLVVSQNTQLPSNFKDNPDAWNHILWFYSDNNSCLRKSIWEQLPLPEVSFGEDQLWAQRIINAGYDKCYAPNAVVIHSHNFDYNEVYERSKIESEFHYKFFNFEHIESEEDLTHILEIINENDKQWGKKNKYSIDEISSRMALNEAQLRGYLDGKNGDTIFEELSFSKNH